MSGASPRLLDALRGVTNLILDSETPVYGLRPEALQLAQILTQSAPGFSADGEDVASGETRTADGLALSPRMAAMCVDGCNRTLAFIRGTHAAILEIRRRHPERPARILYAGCGPYATLAAPLMSIFPAAQVQFTLVDIHGESVESARAVMDRLELIDRVTVFETMDAGALRINPDQPPDIVLMEIMRSCLEDEPQVAISRHLLAQAAGAILVPAEIRIDLVLVNCSAEFGVADSGLYRQRAGRDRIPVGPVFVLNRNSIDSWKGNGGNRLPGATVQLPEYSPERHQPMLFTTISVYENHVLRDYDSGLTCPRLLPVEGGIGPGDSIHFYYELGQHPALKADCLRGGAGPD